MVISVIETFDRMAQWPFSHAAIITQRYAPVKPNGDHAALPLRPEKIWKCEAKRSKVFKNELATQWELSRTRENRHEPPGNYLERQASALVLCMHKTSAEGRRSGESGVMTQYSRRGSAERATWAYRARRNNA